MCKLYLRCIYIKRPRIRSHLKRYLIHVFSILGVSVTARGISRIRTHFHDSPICTIISDTTNQFILLDIIFLAISLLLFTLRIILSGGKHKMAHTRLESKSYLKKKLISLDGGSTLKDSFDKARLHFHDAVFQDDDTLDVKLLVA